MLTLLGSLYAVCFDKKKTLKTAVRHVSHACGAASHDVVIGYLASLHSYLILAAEKNEIHDTISTAKW